MSPNLKQKDFRLSGISNYKARPTGNIRSTFSAEGVISVPIIEKGWTSDEMVLTELPERCFFVLTNLALVVFDKSDYDRPKLYRDIKNNPHPTVFYLDALAFCNELANDKISIASKLLDGGREFKLRFSSKDTRNGMLRMI